jgi:hypothetical protein
MDKPPAPMERDYAEAIESRGIWVVGDPVQGLISLIPKPQAVLLIENATLSNGSSVERPARTNESPMVLASCRVLPSGSDQPGETSQERPARRDQPGKANSEVSCSPMTCRDMSLRHQGWPAPASISEEHIRLLIRSLCAVGTKFCPTNRQTIKMVRRLRLPGGRDRRRSGDLTLFRSDGGIVAFGDASLAADDSVWVARLAAGFFN